MQKKIIALILSPFLSHGVFAQVNEVSLLGVPPSDEGMDIRFAIDDSGNNSNHYKIKNNISKSRYPKVIAFEVRNNGAYVGYATVDFTDARGNKNNLRSPDLSIGQVHRFEIPRLSTNISANAYSYSGLIWAPTKTAFSQTLSPQTSGMSAFGEGLYYGITLTGTTLHPRSHTHEVSKGIGHYGNLDPYALHPDNCTEVISNSNTKEVWLQNYCEFSVMFNTTIESNNQDKSHVVYVKNNTSRKYIYQPPFYGFSPSIPQFPMSVMTQPGYPQYQRVIIAKNKNTGAVNIYRPNRNEYVQPPSGEPESDNDWTFIGPRRYGKIGKMDDIYWYDNPYNNSIELFRLKLGGNYNAYYPTDKQDSKDWAYISPREWREYDPEATNGNIYIYNNPNNGQTELFELKDYVSGIYSYFPVNKISNKDWNYVGYIQPDPS